MAAVEARCHSTYSLDNLRHRLDSEPPAGRQHGDALPLLRKRLHANGPLDRVPLVRRWGGWIHIRRFSKNMGKATSVPARYCLDHCQQCLGRCCGKNLCKPSLGASYPGNWSGAFRSSGKRKCGRSLLRSCKSPGIRIVGLLRSAYEAVGKGYTYGVVEFGPIRWRFLYTSPGR